MNYKDFRYTAVSPNSLPSSIALVSATGKPFFWKKEPGNTTENLSVRGKPDLTRKEEQTLSPEESESFKPPPNSDTNKVPEKKEEPYPSQQNNQASGATNAGSSTPSGCFKFETDASRKLTPARNCSLGSTEKSEISKVAESEGGHSKPFPQHYLIEDHLKTPEAVKRKKFAFGWTQSMKKTPFGSPFLKVHGMYSRGISSLGQVSRTNTDNGKSDKESIEMSGKVTFTPTRPNIVERNVCLKSLAVQSSSADQLMSQGGRSCITQFTPADRLSTQEGVHPFINQRGKGQHMSPIAQSTPTDPLITPGGRYHLINRERDDMKFSFASSFSRNSARRDSISSYLDKSGIPFCESSEESSSGQFSIYKRTMSGNRKSNTEGRRSPSVQYERSRSPDLYRGSRNRSPSIHHRSRSPGLDRGRRNRSPTIHHTRSRSPGFARGRRNISPSIHNTRSRSPGLDRGRRSRSTSIHHRSRSPGLYCGRRSRSPSIHHRSRSPGLIRGRRSRSPSTQKTSSRIPCFDQKRRSRSPSVQIIQQVSRSRSPPPKLGRRSESPSTYYARSRSPVLKCGRSKRPVLGHGGSRSPSLDCGKVSISPRRLRSPSINIGNRICHRSPSPSTDLWRRSSSSSIHSLRLERRGKSQRTNNGSINRSGKLGGRQSRSPSINLRRSSERSRSNHSSINRITRSRSSSSEILKIRRKSLDRSSSESWTEVQIGRNKNLRNKGFWDNENEREKQNFSLVALYSSEEEALNPQKLVNSENGYWEKIKRLKTDQDRLWLAKTEFENPVCSDPVTNLTFHGYKRKKAHMMEKDDDDSFYEFFTNPDIVRLKEVKYEKRQKFYIKEGRVLPMPGYIQKTDLRRAKKSVFSEDVPREILDAERFKALIQKGFYQKFQNKSQTASCRSQERDKKSLIAHFKNGQDEAMQFLKFYNSEFDRSQVEEAVYLEKMYKIFSCHYGKTQRLYCKTCAFPHSF